MLENIISLQGTILTNKFRLSHLSIYLTTYGDKLAARNVNGARIAWKWTINYYRIKLTHSASENFVLKQCSVRNSQHPQPAEGETGDRACKRLTNIQVRS